MGALVEVLAQLSALTREAARGWVGAGGWETWEKHGKTMGNIHGKVMEKHGEHLKSRKKMGKACEKGYWNVFHMFHHGKSRIMGEIISYIYIYIISINLDESYRPHRDITRMMYVSELLGLRCQHGQLENQPFHSRIFPASHV